VQIILAVYARKAVERVPHAKHVEDDRFCCPTQRVLPATQTYTLFLYCMYMSRFLDHKSMLIKASVMMMIEELTDGHARYRTETFGGFLVFVRMRASKCFVHKRN
jgi:hypothetical protein